ncbi:putative membrane protein [Duganella sp. 3397]|uniref:Uncharacterized protein n=1 Tax=Duganella phyllosphaerae TaxID=762836 RepID=A0A1E7WRI8_9BURK|nr:MULTISPECIES: DUF1700 domain-containing protein [Duganella]MDR7049024.1 putative membrane protein [Duganella sp. 3397]OFA02152.1 hypothetical protein DUPY_20360 [Duganella phyllosphaerae]
MKPETARQSPPPPRHILRTVGSLVGLSFFNLFMVIPAMVYASLLLAAYLSAFSCYIGGVAVTASGLSGQNELALQGPIRQVMALTNSHFDTREEEEQAMGWKVAITSRGVQVFREPETSTGGNVGNVGNVGNLAPDAGSRNARIWDRAEAVATGDMTITTDFDSGARTTQTLIGLGLVLGGIGLCLVCIVLTRYTLVGMRRYAAMNMSLLRGH